MDKKEKLTRIISEFQETLEKAQTELEQLDETTYSIGDRFVWDTQKFILGRQEPVSSVSFICLKDGHLYLRAFKVEDVHAITEKEIKIIGQSCTFTRYWDSQRKIKTE